MAGNPTRKLAGVAADKLVRAAIRALRHEGPTYQPLPGTDAARPTEQRWKLIRQQLVELKPGSVLEVGCAEGYFVRRVADELDCFALGVENLKKRVLKGELQRLSAGDRRVAIMRARLDPEQVRRLPHCDVALCLSMLHHVINRHGMDGGRDFLAALASVTNRAIIFETGAPRLAEFRTDGGKGVPRPPEEQEPHIRWLLEGAGLTDIREFGRSPGFQPKYERVLYVCTVPDQAGDHAARQAEA